MKVFILEGRGRLKEHRMLLIWYEVHVNKPHHACLSFLTLLYQNIFSIKIRSLFFSNFSIPRIPKSFRYLWTPRLFHEVWKIERICNTIGIIIQDSKWTKDELCCDLWTCLISRTTPQKYYFTHLCEISTFVIKDFF